MAEYTISLLERQPVAEDTMAFWFSKPAGFQFEPGQYITLVHPEPPETDTFGNKRDFSIASAPHEDRLMFATRLRDTSFKRVMKVMPIGTTMSIEGPQGKLRFDPSRQAVFLAGGIGITPLYAMAKHAAHLGVKHNMTMLYANRRPELAAFVPELQNLEKQLPNFKLVQIISDVENSKQPWDGPRGFIDATIIRQHVPDRYAPIYYITGPPQFITAMQQLLHSLAIHPRHIRSEEFAGY